MSSTSARRPPSARGLSPRTRVGVVAGAAAGAASRLLGRGSGATLPGKVTLAVAPGAMAELARDRTTAVVTGTNGKTATTAFLVAALEGAHPGDVVTNATGANLPSGVVSALAGSPATTAVLETDELHVPAVMSATSPRVLVLLNLSRDQLDRTHEVRRAADLWRAAIAAAGDGLTVVANAADPNVVHAAADGDTVWVDGGLRWFGDAELCPRCGEILDRPGVERDESGWRSSCGFAQPDAAYRVVVDDEGVAVLAGPDGDDVALAPALPGAANLSNAAFAVAAAVQLGVDAAEAARSLGSVGQVAGRYSKVTLGTGLQRDAQLLLAKNPAGWTVALDLIDDDAVVALGVNARIADGTDTSWLWDVPFEHLAGRRVGVFGDRAADLELRLRHAGVETVRAPGRGVVADAHSLAATLPAGELVVLSTYTAFEEVRRGA